MNHCTKGGSTMTDNQDLLAMTHLGEDPSKYMKSVTPPIFMNSLHVFDSVEDYFSVDIFKDEYYYGRASNPTVTILEKKLAALEHGTRAVVFLQEWLPAPRQSSLYAKPEAM